MLVLLDSCVDEFADDVTEQCGIGLAELLDVELIAVEGLDLLVVLLRHHLAELVQEDVLGLRDVLRLHPDELRHSHSLVSLLRQAQQPATVLEVDFPGVQDGPGD